MTRLKVTVTEILTLSPGAELIENLVSSGEELGPHLRVKGQLYCPFMIWMVFEPRTSRTPAELEIGLGHGYRSCPDSAIYEDYLAAEEMPAVEHSIEVIPQSE